LTGGKGDVPSSCGPYFSFKGVPYSSYGPYSSSICGFVVLVIVYVPIVSGGAGFVESVPVYFPLVAGGGFVE
jgi:hypothetical protein